MDLIEEIEKFEREVQKSVEEAAKRNDTSKIVADSSVLEGIENLSVRHKALKDDFQELNRRFYLKPSLEVRSRGMLKERKEIDVSGLSAKAQGEMRRQKFVQKAKDKGVSLVRIKGVKYKTDRYDLVGIASASERIANNWFLGLPIVEYDTIVLLCQDESGEVYSFILSKQFMNEIYPYLSKSNGQYKFNVNRKFDHFYLSVPDIGVKEIASMIDKFGNL